MGKRKTSPKTTSPLATSPRPAPESPEKAAEEAPDGKKLREVGNRLHEKKEYAKALEAYNRALKQTGKDAKEDLASLHYNKAASLLMQNKYKEAVNECTSALEACPSYKVKALGRRARAYEGMGHYKQALSDARQVVKAEPESEEYTELERKLRELVAGKKPPSPTPSVSSTLAVANGATAAAAPHAATNGAYARQQQRHPAAPRAAQPQRMLFTAKCTLEGETRTVHFLATATYADLLHTVKQKFPLAGPFKLKYMDREGDLVTITERKDVVSAMQDNMEVMRNQQMVSRNGAYDAHGARSSAALAQQMLQNSPPLRLQLVPVEDPAEVPTPPEEELAMLQALMEQHLAQQREKQAAELKAKKEAEGEAATTTEDLGYDQWLMDFANLFKEKMGIDPDLYLDFTQIAYDKLQAGLEDTIQTEKAVEILDQAALKFQEVSALSMLNWGTVYACKANRLRDGALLSGRPLSEIREEAMALYEQAEGKYRRSLTIKEDHVDSPAALATLNLDRAKMVAGFGAIPDRPSEEKKKELEKLVADPKKPTKEEQQALLEAQNQRANKATQLALSKITKESVAEAEPYLQAAWANFEEGLAMIPKEFHGRPMKQLDEEELAEAQANPQATESKEELWAHLQVMWGNSEFEVSQMWAAVGDERWRPTLERAAGRFKAAGCPAVDVRSALGNHTRCEELGLAPLEEVKAQADAEAAERKASKAAAKAAAKKPAAEEEEKKGPELNGHKKEEEGSKGEAAAPPKEEKEEKKEKKEEKVVEPEGPKGLPSLGPKPKSKKKGSSKAQA